MKISEQLDNMINQIINDNQNIVRNNAFKVIKKHIDESDFYDDNTQNKNEMLKYGLEKVYNIGGSTRYKIRSKKYRKTVKKPRKQSEGNKVWMEFVQEVRDEHPELSQKEILKLASQLYRQ